MLACCLDGRMRDDFLFFPSFDERGDRLAGDVRALAEVAESGAAVAAKDVSMAGMIGSLAMLLEANRLGVQVDMDELPVPEGVPVADWLSCFPCFAFLLTTPDDRVEECAKAFTARGLTARLARHPRRHRRGAPARRLRLGGGLRPERGVRHPAGPLTHARPS
ncbi:AIR synthase-related protein [Nonomuraea ferruginea]